MTPIRKHVSLGKARPHRSLPFPSPYGKPPYPRRMQRIQKGKGAIHVGTAYRLGRRSQNSPHICSMCSTRNISRAASWEASIREVSSPSWYREKLPRGLSRLDSGSPASSDLPTTGVGWEGIPPGPERSLEKGQLLQDGVGI